VDEKAFILEQMLLLVGRIPLIDESVAATGLIQGLASPDATG
jgi:hypothetical protein